MTTFQKAIVTATVAVLAGAGFYEARQDAQLRDQVQKLQQQQTPLAGQVEQLIRERDRLTKNYSAIRDENERLNSNSVELIKLRGMVGTLRRELEAQQTAAANQPTNSTEASMVAHKPGTFISKDRLAHAGFKTPEAALQTYFQAILSGNYDNVVAVMSAQTGAPDPTQREIFEKGFREASNEISRFQGLQMLAKKVIADDKIEVAYLFYEEDKAPTIQVQSMLKEGSEWKAGNSLSVDSSWSESGQIQPLTP